MRTLRGMLIYTVAVACVLAATDVEAQIGQMPQRPSFTPQPLFMSQSPYAAGQPMGYSSAMPSQAMYPPNMYGAMPPGAMGVYPAAYGGPVQGPMQGPMGPMQPPSPGDPMMGEQYPADAGYPMGEEGGFCPYCGGAGCEQCSGHHEGILAGWLHSLLPYSEGGCCAPRWYDISVDGMYMTRDEVSEFVPFTSFTRFGPTVLSSDSMDYDNQPGGRFTAALQMLPGVALDLSYFGLFSWSANASVESPINELFSPYSGFGALIGVGQPFDESDQARFHSLRSSSTIDSFEISVRKFWTGPNCRLQGSYRSGVRYVYLVDDLNFFTLGRDVPIGLGIAPAGQSNTDVRAHNSLIGWQAGFDLWANIVPGISVGTDLKAGVYGNHAKVNTRVQGATAAGGVTADLFESATNKDIAVVGEANLVFIYRINPNLTMRAGYTALFIDGLALATENFNTENPFNAVRQVQAVTTDGHAFFHGGFAGLEWMW